MIPRSASAVVALFALGAAACSSPTGSDARLNTPETARLVTSDIAHFWAAFDAMHSASDTLPLRRDYLDAGTAGLKDFTRLRWKDASTLASMVWPHRDYYASIRTHTLSIAALEPQIRQAYRALHGMYDDAVFPDVYFAIGGMATGGTTSDHGLLIGAEMFARAEDSPTAALTPWQQSVIRSVDVIPAVVAHELTHYQQRFGAPPTTLLAKAIEEGSADFVSALLTGKTINEHVVAYGDAHEREIWIEFQSAMDGLDHSQWLYNGGTIASTSGRPADLGYYVGAQIAKAYYDSQSDKRQALRDILTISDFHHFLVASGYASRFPP